MALTGMVNQPIQQNYQNQQSIQQNPIFFWTNGQEEATRSPIPANSWALIMDKQADVFYIRRRDAYGNESPLEIYDFSKRVVIDPNSPVGREEFSNLTLTVSNLREGLDEINQTLSKWGQIMSDLGAGQEAAG